MWKGHLAHKFRIPDVGFALPPVPWLSPRLQGPGAQLVSDLFELMKALELHQTHPNTVFCQNPILLQLNQKWWKYDGNIWKPLSVGRSPNSHLRSNPRTWASWALNTNTSSSCRRRNLGQKVMLFHLCNHWLAHRQAPSSSKFSARGRDLIIRWILIGVQTFDGWWLKWIKSR